MRVIALVENTKPEDREDLIAEHGKRSEEAIWRCVDSGGIWRFSSGRFTDSEYDGRE